MTHQELNQLKADMDKALADGRRELANYEKYGNSTYMDDVNMHNGIVQAIAARIQVETIQLSHPADLPTATTVEPLAETLAPRGKN